jgi:PKD repeat protein
MRSASWAFVVTVVLLISSLSIGLASAALAVPSGTAGAPATPHAPASSALAPALRPALPSVAALLKGPITSLLAPSSSHPEGSFGSASASPSANPRWVDVNTTTTGNTRGLRYASMSAYDPADNETVVYGGLQWRGAHFASDTWVYRNGAWVNITAQSATNPGPLAAGQMAFDPAIGKIVLTGGIPPEGNGIVYPLTWTFAHGNWTNVTSTTGKPVGTALGALVWDSSDNEMVLWGGVSANSNGHLDPYTWVLSGMTWTNATGTSGVTPPLADLVVPVGSNYPAGAGAIISAGEGVGAHGPSPTYLFHAGAWTNITSTTGTPGVSWVWASVVYDNALHAPVEFGGENATGSFQQYTYALIGGTWKNLSVLAGPVPTGIFSDVVAGDSAGGIVLVEGLNEVLGSNGGDTWNFASPLSVSASAAPTVVDVGQTVSFVGSYIGGAEPVTWGWTFGDLTSSPLGTTTHTYTTPGSFTATFWAQDALDNNASWTQVITVSAVPVVHASAAPAPTDVGRPVWFTGSVVGGTAPVTYWWGFGDGGSSIAQDPVHTFAKAGTYHVWFFANDSVGLSGSSSVSVVVSAAPTVSATATPTSAATGASVAFAATPTGGTGPYTYWWNFTDGSWSTASAPRHAFATAGTYKVYLTVTDAAGATANTTATVTVWEPLTVSVASNVGGGTVGTAFTFTATSAGGAGGTTYAWSESPATGLGCTASTTATLSCTSATVGQYTVTVSATDSAGHTATASVVVNVLAAASSGSSSSSGFSTTAIAVMGVLAVLVVLFAVMWAMKGKGGKGKMAAAAAPAPAAAAPMEPAPTAPAAPPPAQSWPSSPPPPPPQ